MRTQFKEHFTLVELIVVMVLLGTIFAVSAPVLADYFRGRSLTEEARRMMAVLRYARNEAISLCVPVDVRLTPETGIYALAGEESYSEHTAEIERDFVLDDGLELEIEDEFLDSDGTAVIKFYPDGAVDPESPKTVLIRNSRDETMELALPQFGANYVISPAPDIL